MQSIIDVKQKDLFLLNTELLGTNEAELWIGPSPDGPTDNDDVRVLRERAEEAQKQQAGGARISGISAMTLTQSAKYPGWFEVDTSSWIPGIYRFNIHSRAHVAAPNGTPLRPVRDGEYSWPNVSLADLHTLSDEQKKFLYLERNKTGYCLRIEITPERDILPAGDGLEWIHDWSKINKSE